jgi:hypothetical protein
MTNKTNLILVSGTGKMGSALMRGLEKDPRYDLCNFAITESGNVQIGQKTIMGVTPGERSEMVLDLVDKQRPFMIVDAVPASASQANAEYYSRFENLPVIMMSTGIKDFSRIKNTLMLPNACLPILTWEKFITHLDEGIFGDGYDLQIQESHQITKPDVSDTARKFVAHFNRLGIAFDESQIVSYRAEKDYLTLGIPSMFHGAHGFHQYTLSSNRPNDFLLKQFVDSALTFFSSNPVFTPLFHEDLPLKSTKHKTEKGYFWGNELFQDTFYRTFMFGIQLVLGRKKTQVDVFHSVFGHQPYVDGVLDYAIPFLQYHCQNGLMGKNFTTQDLYTWAMQ